MMTPLVERSGIQFGNGKGNRSGHCCGLIPQVTSAGRREQHLSVHSFLLRYDCRPYVQRDPASFHHPPESAAESLLVLSFSFLDCDIRRLGTNYGLPLAGGSTAGRIKRLQEYVCPIFLALCVCVPLSANRFNRNPQSTLDDRPTDEPSQWPTASRRSRRPDIPTRSIAELWNDCEIQDYRHTRDRSTVHFGRDASDH